MSTRHVYERYGTYRQCVGSVRKYVGATARTMGSDPAYVAYPLQDQDRATVHASWTLARDHLLAVARRWEVTP